MTETSDKSKELTVIKGQMVDVISNLQSTHQLEEIMPLLNLLKTLENYINSLSTGKWKSWSPAIQTNETQKLGTETIKITEKISFLLNRIHIESAYLASINNSVAYGIKQFYRRKDISQFVQQKIYSQEKKKLFVVALKLLLRDHESVNTTGLNLDFLSTMLLENIDSGIGSLMRLINRNCQICCTSGTAGDAGTAGDGTAAVSQATTTTTPERFCFCQVILNQSIESRRHSGLLRFNLRAFMGIYEAEYLDRMLKENAPRLILDQLNCDGPGKPRRRCVLMVRDQFVQSSWTGSALALSGEIAITKAKEVEIQVWQAAPTCSKAHGTAAHDRIVAVAIVTLDSLLQQVQTGDIDGAGTHSSSAAAAVKVALEPDGFVMCEMRLEPPLQHGPNPRQPLSSLLATAPQQQAQQQPVCKKFGIKRRMNIFTKLGGHRLARHTEANVPVSMWTDWFQHHIDRLAIPIERERQKAAEIQAKEKKIACLCGTVKRFVKKALGVSKLHKLAITPHKIVTTSTPRSGNRRYKSPARALFSDKYQLLSESPLATGGASWRDRARSTPKMSQMNPRTVCKFIQFDLDRDTVTNNSPVAHSNGGAQGGWSGTVKSTDASLERGKSRAAALLACTTARQSLAVANSNDDGDKTPCTPRSGTNEQRGVCDFLRRGEQLKSALQLARNSPAVRSNIELAAERAHIPAVATASTSPLPRAQSPTMTTPIRRRDTVDTATGTGTSRQIGVGRADSLLLMATSMGQSSSQGQFQEDESDADCDSGWRESNLFSKSVLQSPFRLDVGLDLLPSDMSSPQLPEFGDEQSDQDDGDDDVDDDQDENRDPLLTTHCSVQRTPSQPIHHNHHGNSHVCMRSSSNALSVGDGDQSAVSSWGAARTGDIGDMGGAGAAHRYRERGGRRAWSEDDGGTEDDEVDQQQQHHLWLAMDTGTGTGTASAGHDALTNGTGTGTGSEHAHHISGESGTPLSPGDSSDRHRPLRIGDLDLISVLGIGHFGKVVLARHRARNAVCAVKSIQKSRACVEPEYESLLAEKSILMTVTRSRHPFLVGLIGCFQTERYLLFAMEYAAGGDLMGHIHKSPFAEPDAKFYIACVVLALEFLHDRDIVFRDLKLDNVLMDARGFAKLADFGLSKENMSWNEFTSTFCGTPEFLAPEIISMQEYTRVVDWWALGVLLYEMVVGESPFPGDEDDEIYSAILQSVPDPKQLSADALALVMRLLQHAPEKRLGYGEHGARHVKAHQFFDDFQWDALLARTLRPPFVPALDSAIDTQYFECEFTDKPLTIEHEELVESDVIYDNLFRDFDTCQQWPSSAGVSRDNSIATTDGGDGDDDDELVANGSADGEQ